MEDMTGRSETASPYYIGIKEWGKQQQGGRDVVKNEPREPNYGPRLWTSFDPYTSDTKISWTKARG